MTRNGSGFLLGAVLACAVCLVTAPAAGQDLLITGGKLIDPGTGRVTRADLLAVGGTIVAVGEIRLPPEGFAGETLDASGKWIVPGLRDLHVYAFGNRTPGRAAEAGATAVTHVPAEEMPDDLPGFLAERGTVMIPTLANLDTALATEPALLEDPLLASLTTGEILAAYREFPTAGDPERAERVLRSMTSAQERRLVSVGELADAGVPIVAGTDSGNPWTVQGFSLHRELEYLVAAGLEPMEALAAATTAAGDFLAGHGERWGLAPGDPASLLILDASPLEDVRSTRAIHAVVHHGRVVEREAPVADD